MSAGLMAARLREACAHSNLLERAGWAPDDDVEAVELPLAKATEKVLSSMQIVLEKTLAARDAEMKTFGTSPGASVGGVEGEENSDSEAKRRYLAETKAAEVRVVRHAKDLLHPQDRYKAEALDV